MNQTPFNRMVLVVLDGAGIGAQKAGAEGRSKEAGSRRQEAGGDG